MDKKEQKLEFLKNAFWKEFERTGKIEAYGRYKGTQQLIMEHHAQKNKAITDEFEM